MNIFLVIALLSSTQIPCGLIAPFVATYGQAAVADWAKAHGYSDAQIAEVIRRCRKK